MTVAISRRTSRAVASITAAIALAVPTLFAPATAASPLDNLGRPNEQILTQMENLAENPATPAQLQPVLKRLVGFFRGDGEPGVDIPQNGPAFTQFGWPTIAGSCIDGKNNAVGTAAAVPGPAALPLPGVGRGEVNFVFTALGTGTVAQRQTTQMNVQWVNINNGRMGTTRLGYNGINPEGPATVNGTAKTGSGTVLAVVTGGVTTDNDGGPSNCNFLPTAAIIPVR